MSAESPVSMPVMVRNSLAGFGYRVKDEDLEKEWKKEPRNFLK